MITLGWVTLLLLVVLFAGLPVAFGLGTTSVLLIGLFGLPMKIIANTMFTSLDSFVVIAIPLFILMSRVLLDGRVGDDLFEVMNVWVRHLPGGLAIATILACAFFAAISGSGAATAATIGMVAYPAMLGRGYQKKFILGLLACGGTLGILIPPSIPLIIFGAVTEESIGKLFIAGIIPGLVLTAVLIVYAIYRSKRGGYMPMEAASWRERFRVTRRNLWGIALPFLILGGIYIGVFTPGGICAGYSVVTGAGFPVGVAAFGDDVNTGAVEGFTNGELLTYRLWDSQAGAEYAADASYSEGGDHYAANGLSQLRLSSSHRLVPAEGNHFQYVRTDNNQSLVVGTATLDGSSLVTGDEIGVFTPGGLCAGASTVTADGFPVGIAAWGDDPNSAPIDGFRTGESFSFRYYEAAAGAEYAATAHFTEGPQAYQANAVTQLTLSGVRGGGGGADAADPGELL